jgi:hypothetical protein
MVKRKTALYVLLALIALGGLGWLGFDLGHEAYKDFEEDRAVAELTAAMQIPEGASAAEIADHIRVFILENSIHKIDEEFYAHWGNQPVIIGKMLTYNRDKSAPPPHMECSSRSGLMRLVMNRLGYRTRNIDLYMHADRYPGHTYMEFFNPDSKDWEAQDVDFNVFWIERKTGRRVKTEDLIKNDLINYIPCTAPGVCAWERPDKEMSMLRERLALAVVIDKEAGERYILVNTKRFDMDKPAMADGKMQTYCEYRDKDCRQEIIKFD